MIKTSINSKFLSHVPSAPPDQEWVYQVGKPFQLGPTQAGLFCNIRRAGVTAVDLEVGNDLLLFDRLEPTAFQEPLPLHRSCIRPHPKTGEEKLLSIYTVRGGFVPLGAKLQDGRPHPHAGTGFGLALALGYDTNLATVPAEIRRQTAPLEFYLLQQYRWDGTRFQITSEKEIGLGELLPGMRMRGGLAVAVPDGADLLLPFGGSKTGEPTGTTGVTRWRCEDGEWRMTNYMPVTPSGNYFEPSLVRDTDEALVFTARGASGSNLPIEVWCSVDGVEWNKIIDEPDRRAGGPVSIGRLTNGTPYIAGGPASGDRGSIREQLWIWPLTHDRAGLQDPLVVRDCPAEFGFQNGQTWQADNAVANVVRLTDGKLHALLAYRVAHHLEICRDASVTAHTGCYIAEFTTDAPEVPLWRI